MGDDIAFAVRRAAAVPPAVAFGQFPDRGIPGSVIERRLDIVVAVEQDGRRAGRSRAPGHDRLTAVGCFVQIRVGQPLFGERLGHPLRGPMAFLRRELPGICHRTVRNQLGQIRFRSGMSECTCARSSAARASSVIAHLSHTQASPYTAIVGADRRLATELVVIRASVTHEMHLVTRGFLAAATVSVITPPVAQS